MAIRIGFVGAGTRAQCHLRALAQLNAEGAGGRNQIAHIIAVCDPDSKRAQAFAARCGAQSFRSARQMIEAGGLDAIYICVPPHAHRDAEILAAQNGCALLIEPPIAASLSTARRIQAALNDSKTLCAVAYCWRYAAAFERASKYFGGRIPSSVAPLLLDAQMSAGYRNVAWWKNPAQGGGPLVSDATPLLDVMRAFGREVQAVFAVQSRRDILRWDAEAKIADAIAVTLQFRNGALGQLALSLHPRATPSMSLRLRGRDVEAELSPRRLSLRRDEEVQTWPDEDDDALRKLNRLFLEAVATGKRTALIGTYADATKTLKLALAANQSLKTGKIVRLNEK